MSARILNFPDAPALLRLDGYTLIAWRLTPEGDVFPDEGNHYTCLWRPASGKGWCEWGDYYPASHDWPEYVNYGRISRAGALHDWRRNDRASRYRWHYLCSGLAAFPEKRRKYLRPPHVLAHA
jgi:hypothetical protein